MWLRTVLKTHWLRRWRRMLLTLAPLVAALAHVGGVAPMELLDRLDNIFYDLRLRATMPRTLDDRIVIIDIDEHSLEIHGQWPWSRDKLSALAQELFDRQHVAVLGFDVIFGEADRSSGLAQLQELARGPLRQESRFQHQFRSLAAQLDYDARFAQALEGRPAVLGYYLTSDRDGKARGALPASVLTSEDLRGLPLRSTSWNGYGSNLPILAQAAPKAGFFNSITDTDGVVRSLPLLAEYQGQYYESLALAMFRVLLEHPKVLPVFSTETPEGTFEVVQGIALSQGGRSMVLPVDDQIATLVPYRGGGGPQGGSFRYLSASDVLRGQVPPDALKDKLVLVGTTAPGLLDLRVTPVDRAYPGVEAHANLLSAFLDGRSIVRPDFALGYDVAQLLASGLLLALLLPHLSASGAVVATGTIVASLLAANWWLYVTAGLALPIATAILSALLAFALNMVYGYFVETRAKRGITQLFATYVPPELVDEMALSPERYSMKAQSRELTVMFCDMRGFTAMSETMEPAALQALLNDIFSRLTHVIRAHRGTIDKYMGDCVMAFWGAPVPTPEHAHLAVQAALAMTLEVQAINESHRAQGLPQIGIGIGINTGLMSVGDMGSDIRRAYTVIGDAVNLASRLEGLSKTYGVEMVVSEFTRAQAPDFLWLELDRVRVKGKERAVEIFTPLASSAAATEEESALVRQWHQAMQAYRHQEWQKFLEWLAGLPESAQHRPLTLLYRQRVQELQSHPPPAGWDGVTGFETK